jgi:D-glycero-D-manno-heptose 1,7-bisphosphate phosphatase
MCKSADFRQNSSSIYFDLSPMKIFFLDLDGTLRQTKSGETFINRPDDQQAIPGALAATEYLSSIGFILIGITNQGGCAAIDPATNKPRKSLEDAIEEQKITLELFPKLSEIYFCPSWGENCFQVSRSGEINSFQAPIGNSGGSISCRKPGHGMLLQAFAGIHSDADPVEWGDSWMSGDRNEDEVCAASGIVNFIWANLMLKRFGGADCQETPNEIVKKFDRLIQH